MYILKNALKSIQRSKGRSILIGIIIIVIAVSSCVSLSIKNAATKAQQEGLNALSITGQISLERQKIMEKAKADGTDIRSLIQTYSELTIDELVKYSKAESTKDFYYVLTSSINASGTLQPVDTSSSTSSSTTNNNKNQQPKGNNGPLGGMGNQGDFTIRGYNSHSAMTSFVTGISKVTDGTIFNEITSDMVCIINNELATLNNLKVNDRITLANPNVNTETYEFTIIGIYTNTSTDTNTNNMQFSTAQDPSNQIYTSYNTLKAVTEKSASAATTSTNSKNGKINTTALRNQVVGTYVFADVAKFEEFKTQVKALGLADYYSVNSNDVTNYKKSLLPLKDLNDFATTMLLIVLLIGGIILVVFNMFNIRERKFEVGVLTAIGMKKGKVALQFILELFIVTLIAIIIGTAVGSIVSVPVANSMLKNQITSQQTQLQQKDENFGKQGQKNNLKQAMNTQKGLRNQAINYITDINATINFKVVLQLLGIGILLTIISSLAAVVFVLRYEPLKILSERT